MKVDDVKEFLELKKENFTIKSTTRQ